MNRETWFEPTSHYQANGWVDLRGKMTEAEITDNYGLTKDRDRTFESKEDFYAWAKQSAGTNW